MTIWSPYSIEQLLRMLKREAHCQFGLSSRIPYPGRSATLMCTEEQKLSAVSTVGTGFSCLCKLCLSHHAFSDQDMIGIADSISSAATVLQG